MNLHAPALDLERYREVEGVLDAHEAPVGGFTVRRALPGRSRHSVGPWVFLDHFGPLRVKPGQEGVGAHPHAGIETVTYLLAGRQEHRDSAGHQGIVAAGGAQWMTAGRGVVHAERPVPRDDGERTLHGLQLWTSLPRLQKTAAPDYQRIAAADVAARTSGGATLRVVAGELAGLAGPARVRMPLVLAHAALEPGACLEAALDPAFEAAVYVIAGEAAVGAAQARVGAGRLALLAGNAPGLALSNPGAAVLHAMILGGAPAEGPLVFHGPFVMNSPEQVRAAEIAWRTGRMGALEEWR